MLWIVLQWTWRKYFFQTVISFFSNTQDSNCGSYGSSIFNFFLRKLYALFRSGCTNFPSHQRCTWISFLHILPMLVISHLFNNSYSNMCEVIHHYGFFFSIMILIYISILVMLSISWCLCWSSVGLYSLEKCLFRSSAHVFNGIGF